MYICLNDFPLYFNIDGMSERLVLLRSILALLLNLQPVTQLLPLRGLNKNILAYGVFGTGCRRRGADEKNGEAQGGNSDGFVIGGGNEVVALVDGWMDL